MMQQSKKRPPRKPRMDGWRPIRRQRSQNGTKSKYALSEAARELMGHVCWRFLWESGHHGVPEAECEWWEANDEAYCEAKGQLTDDQQDMISHLEARITYHEMADYFGLTPGMAYYRLRLCLEEISKLMG